LYLNGIGKSFKKACYVSFNLYYILQDTDTMLTLTF
jgi:hypothetical protein